eukprot:1195934-Prorocentrum_minimum.AAC.9
MHSTPQPIFPLRVRDWPIVRACAGGVDRSDDGRQRAVANPAGAAGGAAVPSTWAQDRQDHPAEFHCGVRERQPAGGEAEAEERLPSQLHPLHRLQPHDAHRAGVQGARAVVRGRPRLFLDPRRHRPPNERNFARHLRGAALGAPARHPARQPRGGTNQLRGKRWRLAGGLPGHKGRAAPPTPSGQPRPPHGQGQPLLLLLAAYYSRRGSQSWERRRHIPAAGANRARVLARAALFAPMVRRNSCAICMLVRASGLGSKSEQN